MIQLGSYLQVADNSGAKIIKTISILGGKKRDAGQIGDIISASVKEADTRGTVKKKSVVRAVIVRQKKSLLRPDGTIIRFDNNAAVIIDKDGSMKGTRIFGPIAREIKEKGFDKIISLAKEVW